MRAFASRFTAIPSALACALALLLAGCSGASAPSTPASAAPGTLAFAASTASGLQSNGTIQLSVTRTGGSSGLVSVSYATSNATATAGTDYTAANGVLSWADGDSTPKLITVYLGTTNQFYGTRSFNVTLSSPTNSATLGTSTLAVTITGSLTTPVPGNLAFASSTASVAESAGTVSLSVNRTTGANGIVTLNYATANGTAVAGINYTTTAGTLTWPDGDFTSKTITIPLNTSVTPSSSLTFTVVLSAPAGSMGAPTLGSPSTATVTVTPSAIGTLGFSASTTAVAQAAATTTISVARTGGSAGAVGITYATSDGTAAAGTDYTSTTGTLSWSSGDSTPKTITVPISTAYAFNGTRAFTVTLSAPTGGATLGVSSNAVTITGTALVPSSCTQYSFSPYKLTLPVDVNGGTGNTLGAATITTSQITSGFVDAYFYADSSCNIIFTAPSNGATTTPGSGSDHTRSELRELYTGSGADSNSDWNSSIGGTLTATGKFNSVSADTDEGIIGQVHGQTYVFMLLNYIWANKTVDVDIFTTNTSTSKDVRTVIASNINIGTVINYKIVYSGNSMVVTVNGNTMTFPIDPSWANTPVYFKLGAYHGAPNSGNPAGDQTQTSFSAFAITHP